MQGLEAIMHYNGFAMAAVGVTIVFTVLVVLSFFISQLHRLLMLWENRRRAAARIRLFFTSGRPKEEQKEEPLRESGLQSMNNESVRQFELLVKSMGEPFSLPELISMAEVCGISRPHSKASSLIKSNIIAPDNRGFFVWNHEVSERLLKRSR